MKGDLKFLVVSVTARDRLGIVADVTEELYKAGCNLGPVTSTRLGVAFGMLLVVEVPQDGESSLRARLQEIAVAKGLAIHVDDYSGETEVVPGGARYTVTVHGADHPGIVAQVAGLLGARGVNINELFSYVAQVTNRVYIMTLEIVVPPDLAAGDLKQELEELGRQIDCYIEFSAREPPLL